jgi:hypothetical protein
MGARCCLKNLRQCMLVREWIHVVKLVTFGEGFGRAAGAASRRNHDWDAWKKHCG